MDIQMAVFCIFTAANNSLTKRECENGLLHNRVLFYNGKILAMHFFPADKELRTLTCLLLIPKRKHSYFCIVLLKMLAAFLPSILCCGARIRTHVTSVELHQTGTFEGRSTN